MKGRKGRWLNTTIVKNERIPKPCIKLKYCPYGLFDVRFRPRRTRR